MLITIWLVRGFVLDSQSVCFLFSLNFSVFCFLNSTFTNIINLRKEYFKKQPKKIILNINSTISR